MKLTNLKHPAPNPFYRCAGPNCGILKQSSDRWWLMWTSSEHFNQPALYLCAWDEDVASPKALCTFAANSALRSCNRSSWGTFGRISSAG